MYGSRAIGVEEEKGDERVALGRFMAGCFPVDPCMSGPSIFQALDDM